VVGLKALRLLVIFAAVLALFVVMLGAYTRLTDAGLGCPDWPGCYGHMIIQQPSSQHHLSTPVESRKALTEMVHRYFAGTLASLIFVIWFSVLLGNRGKKKYPSRLPSLLVLLVLFQAALGMWTVTLKLLPVVVMGHLLGGISIFAGLCYFQMQLSPYKGPKRPGWRFFIGLGAVLVFLQIALGGWVSANYAGVACVGFPRCNGIWWPILHFSKGFNLFSSIGANYQGGVLDSGVRITIQWVHRLGAFVVAGYMVILGLAIVLRFKKSKLRLFAWILLFLILIQFALGIANVVYLLPLWVAVLHNGGAALLLATVVMMRYLATEGCVDVIKH